MPSFQRRLWISVVRFCALFVLLGSLPSTLRANDLATLLAEPTLDTVQVARQIADVIVARIPKLSLAPSAAAWQDSARQLRQRVLDEVVFRGVPDAWRRPNPRVEWEEATIEGSGYVIRKLRFEALPGLWIPALLYEPNGLSGKVPVVLNVNGHVSTGKSTPYEQIRCINLAKRGILNLKLEWIGMGQLASGAYSHNHLGKLDLCGQSGLAVFYLAMSRGLDVLVANPHADPTRVAVTGLSGGGWQTIILSALDPRVTLSVPVAGYSALAQRVSNRSSIGDLEQNPTDLVSIADYAHLTALLAPRPALLIYNKADDCCFVSETVKPNTFDPVVAFYEQAGAAEGFEYYENSDPGTHNYDRDNRQQLYRFLNRHFLTGTETTDAEIETDGEIRTAEELEVDLPVPNASFDSLAADAAADLPRGPHETPDQSRQRLHEILRLTVPAIDGQPVGDIREAGGLKVQRFRLDLENGLSLAAATVAGDKSERAVLVLSDGGYAAQAQQVQELCAAGARVICVDLTLFGQAAGDGPVSQNAMLLATVGERPLGIQTGQALAVADWFCARLGIERMDVVATGPRTGTIAACAAAIDSGQRLGNIHSSEMPESLKEIVAPAATYNSAPELYCFGLLEYFDFEQLRELSVDRGP